MSPKYQYNVPAMVTTIRYFTNPKLINETEASIPQKSAEKKQKIKEGHILITRKNNVKVIRR